MAQKKKRKKAIEAPAEPATPTPLAPIDARPPLSARDAWIDRALVVVSVAIAFGRTLPYPLALSWDDRRFLIDDDLVTHPSWAAFVSIWTEPHFEAYHPLHLMSYWLDVPWLGAVGGSVRLVSLALFVGVGFAMLAWLRALGIGRFPALLATIAFVVHPVQVELVVWGTGRKDVLAELFGLLAWLAHLRSQKPLDREAWISRGLFVCACLSKTSAITLPLAMFAGDLWLARRSIADAARAQVPAVIVAAVLGLVTIAIWSGHEMIRPVERVTSTATLVLASLSHAFATLLLPDRVSPMYALVEDDVPGTPFLALGIVIVVFVAYYAWTQRETRLARMIGLALTTFLVFYLPVANLLPTYYEMQDRHLSLPLVGFVLALAAVLDRDATEPDARPTPALMALALLCIVPLAARTIQYESVWSSDARLWGHATSTHPRAYYAWMKLGEVRRDEGRFDGAIAAYDHAVTIRPNQVLGYGGLMMALARRDERDEALPAPSHADEFVASYMRDVDDPDRLSRDAGEAAELGYRWVTMMFMSRQLDIAPVSDERLEHAADVQLRNDNEWLARFYVGRMSHPPLMPRMRRFWDQERERLGLPPIPTAAERQAESSTSPSP